MPRAGRSQARLRPHRRPPFPPRTEPRRSRSGARGCCPRRRRRAPLTQSASPGTPGAGLAGAPLADLALEGAPRPGGSAQLPGPRGEGPGWASHFPSVGAGLLEGPTGAGGGAVPSPVISDTAPLHGSRHTHCQQIIRGHRPWAGGREHPTPHGRQGPPPKGKAGGAPDHPPGRGHRLPAEGARPEAPPPRP